MAIDTADLTEGLFSDFGESAVLVGDQWRATVDVIFTPAWAGAVAGGLPMEREEPTVQMRTSDANSYDMTNGWQLEIGSGADAVLYRVTSKADDGLGITLLTVAREQ